MTEILEIISDLCYGCAACIMICPVDALILKNQLAEVEIKKCTLCKLCLPGCPVKAIEINEVINS